jgi:hypothetical protein
LENAIQLIKEPVSYAHGSISVCIEQTYVMHTYAYVVHGHIALICPSAMDMPTEIHSDPLISFYLKLN